MSACRFIDGLRIRGAIGVAAMALTLLPGPLQANYAQDQGAGGVARQGQPRSGAKATEPISLSASNFQRLESYQIRDLNRQRRDGRKIVIGGFSAVMSNWLVYMADADRRRTQRLVREMSAIKDPKKRKAHLDKALRDAGDFKKNLEDSVKRLRERKSWGALTDEQRRLGGLRDFIDGLKIWVGYPHEGTR